MAKIDSASQSGRTIPIVLESESQISLLRDGNEYNVITALLPLH
jgi:hypothetical protein